MRNSSSRVLPASTVNAVKFRKNRLLINLAGKISFYPVFFIIPTGYFPCPADPATRRTSPAAPAAGTHLLRQKPKAQRVKFSRQMPIRLSKAKQAEKRSHPGKEPP
jgi:hypothetical protein